jgi:hypothetical protein
VRKEVLIIIVSLFLFSLALSISAHAQLVCDGKIVHGVKVSNGHCFALWSYCLDPGLGNYCIIASPDGGVSWNVAEGKFGDDCPGAKGCKWYNSWMEVECGSSLLFTLMFYTDVTHLIVPIIPLEYVTIPK